MRVLSPCGILLWESCKEGNSLLKTRPKQAIICNSQGNFEDGQGLPGLALIIIGAFKCAKGGRWKSPFGHFYINAPLHGACKGLLCLYAALTQQVKKMRKGGNC